MGKNKYKSNIIGDCPVCGNHELDYCDTDFDGECVSYSWKCRECESEGKEWYHLVFEGHDVNIYKNEAQENEQVNDYVLPDCEA